MRFPATHLQIVYRKWHAMKCAATLRQAKGYIYHYFVSFCIRYKIKAEPLVVII